LEFKISIFFLVLLTHFDFVYIFLVVSNGSPAACPDKVPERGFGTLVPSTFF
jgi:hypothetical protein